MKKEVVIAIIIGFSLGIIITFGIHTAQRSLSQRDQQQAETIPTPAVAGTTESHTLFINNPQPNSISQESPVQITGSSSPNSMISVIAQESSNTTIADAQGNFSLPLDLEAGVNIITVTSYSEDGQESTITINLVHSTSDLNEVASNQPTPEDSTEDED